MYEMRIKFHADSDVDAIGIAGEVAGRIIEDVDLVLPGGVLTVSKSITVNTFKPDAQLPNVTMCPDPW
jgi:hypothetical protein